MDWEPAHADHSIDRVVVTFNWHEPIEANTFDELLVAGRKAAVNYHLTHRIDIQDAVVLPPAAGNMITINSVALPPRLVAFRSLDQAGAPVEEILIGMRRMAFVTQRYRRWMNLRHMIIGIIDALGSVFPITHNVQVVRVEYIDRFQSPPGGADHFQVIERNSDFISTVLRDKDAALHVHSGWFDYEDGNCRRLTNVNIDVNDWSVPSPDNRRSLTILTLGQFESLSGVLQDPLTRIDTLHDYLKGVFRATITKDAAQRVSLDG